MARRGAGDVAHATAPLRRLADRYVVEAAFAVANGRPVPDDVQAAFAEVLRRWPRAAPTASRLR